MPVVITREAAVAAVAAEIRRLEAEPRAFHEMHIVCALDAIRRGEHDIAMNHVWLLRRGPILQEVDAKPPNRPLLCRERLYAMLVALAGRDHVVPSASLDAPSANDN